LPFCGVTLRGRKPLPEAYPREIKTVGDRIHKRRLDLGLRQRDIAQLLGVHVSTVTNWEVGRSEPALRHPPGLFGFLG
jgi:DNA-binding transcriptional regulator YiaG